MMKRSSHSVLMLVVVVMRMMMTMMALMPLAVIVNDVASCTNGVLNAGR